MSEGQLSPEFVFWARHRLIMFTAEWCANCKRLRRDSDAEQALADAASPLEVRWVDIDAAPDVALAFDVTAVPTVALLRDGELLQRRSVTSVDVVRSLVARAQRKPRPTTKVTMVTEDLMFSGLPAVEQLRAGVEKGAFRTVVSLMNENEPQFDRYESDDIQEAGGKFVHVNCAVDAEDTTIDQVRALFNILNEAESYPTPVLVHCTRGLVAGGLALTYAAKLSEMTSWAQFNQWCHDLDVNIAKTTQFYALLKSIIEK